MLLGGEDGGAGLRLRTELSTTSVLLVRCIGVVVADDAGLGTGGTRFIPEDEERTTGRTTGALVLMLFTTAGAV